MMVCLPVSVAFGEIFKKVSGVPPQADQTLKVLIARVKLHLKLQFCH